MNKDGFQLEPEVRPIVSKYFSIYDTKVGYDHLAFFITMPDDEEKQFNDLRAELKPKGYLPILRSKSGESTLEIIPSPPQKKSKKIINILLLIATIGSTILMGTVHWMGYNGIEISGDPQSAAEVFIKYIMQEKINLGI